MCEFITFAPAAPGVPAPQRGSVSQVGRQIHVERFSSAPHSGHQHPGRPEVYSLTSEGCSCGLLPDSRDSSEGDRSETRLRSRARKLGWTHAKTERALADSRLPKGADAVGSATEKAVRAYLAEVAEVSGGISLIVHTHEAEFSIESFVVRREEKLTAAHLRSSSTLIERDVRYVVRP